MVDLAARVAVIGGGWAGCAAAATLAAAGVPVTLFEQAPALGGRARKVMHDGLALDNGQHLLLGAYTTTFELVALVHGAEPTPSLFRRLPLTLRTFGVRHPHPVELVAWRAPSPFHLVGALLSARGLRGAERLALIADFRRLERAGFRRPSSETVEQCFASSPRRAYAAIWEPLCLAALNTPPATASADIYARVLRAAFTGSASNSDFFVPAKDLSATFPDAAASFVERNGGTVRRRSSVRAVSRHSGGVTLRLNAGSESFASVVVAVGPHQLAATLGREIIVVESCRKLLERVDNLRYESITTIYFALAEPLDLAAPVLRLDNAPGQWLFDRKGLLEGDAMQEARSLVAVVISAGGAHDALDHPTLAAKAEAQLRRLAPDLPKVVWWRVIVERRATYACVAELARPESGRISAGIYLAGDYTDRELPATLEAATRSGVNAARAVIADRQSQRPLL